jgi:hypothetical protein
MMFLLAVDAYQHYLIVYQQVQNVQGSLAKESIANLAYVLPS